MYGFLPALVVVVPLAGALLTLLLGLINEKAVPHFALLIGLVNACFGVGLVLQAQGQIVTWEWIPGITRFELHADGLGSFIAAAAAVLGALIILYSLRYMEHEHGKTRYYSLVLLFIGAMSGLVLSGSLLLTYFFWELCGVCSFSLIGFHYDNPGALKGAIKAFVTTRLGDVGLISGILVLYFATVPHTFNILDIYQQASAIPYRALTFSAFAMLAGAMAKSAQFPFHIWLPDAMEAPTSVSALIHAATMVNAGVYLVARMYPVFKVVPGWTQAVALVGAVTLTLGALMALAARDLKRMLAYSTVSQLGYMFLAAGTGAILASQFHLVSHAIFKALLFLAAGAVIHEAGTRDMGQLSGVARKMPLTSLLFMLGIFGLTGIPPFGGFFSKDMIFSGALAERAYLPLFLAVFGAVLTFTYSWRAFLRVFGGSPSPAVEHAHEVHASMAIPMAVLGIGALISWLLVGMQSSGLAHTAAFHVHHVSAVELLEETFTSTAFLLSLCAMLLGFMVVRRQDRVFGWLEEKASWFMEAAYQGFYIDEAYLRMLSAVGKGAAWATALIDAGTNGIISQFGKAFSWISKALLTFDDQYIEGSGRSLGRSFSWMSRQIAEFDVQVLEGSGRSVANSLEASGRTLSKLQTGDLGDYVVNILLGVSIALIIVLVEVGVRL